MPDQKWYSAGKNTALDTTCPVCGADVDFRCTNQRGHLVTFHVERARAVRWSRMYPALAPGELRGAFSA